MTKTVTLRLDDETYKEFTTRAKLEYRSLGNCIKMAAWQYLIHSEFSEKEEEIAASHRKDAYK